MATKGAKTWRSKEITVRVGAALVAGLGAAVTGGLVKGPVVAVATAVLTALFGS